MNAYHVFLRQIEQPLIQSLNNGESGGAFAEKLIGWQGEIAYEFLRDMGRDALLAVISTYPPIWTTAQQIPTRFGEFIDEFLAGPAPPPGKPRIVATKPVTAKPPAPPAA
jgi:hypothetical protein